MNKCPNCGTEFEGNFCPSCGTKVSPAPQICPKCGKPHNPSARFCENCGYDFKNATSPAPQQAGGGAAVWVKSHKKLVALAAIALVVLIVLIIVIASATANKGSGTYYELSSNGDVSKTSYYELKKGEWRDNDGLAGTYKMSGSNVTFYVEGTHGSMTMATGTIKDGILTVDMGFGKDTYLSQKHKHSYGSWTVTKEPVCATPGQKERVCNSCGAKDKIAVPGKQQHNTDGTWRYNEGYHWQVCDTCGVVNNDVHTGGTVCSKCNYPTQPTETLTFTRYSKDDIFDISKKPNGEYVPNAVDPNQPTYLGPDPIPNETSDYYVVTGYTGNLDGAIIRIPSTYNGLPVIAIAAGAFENSKIIGIILPEGLKYIGSGAFRSSDIISINIPSSVTIIGANLFTYCSSLKEMYFMGTNDWRCTDTVDMKGTYVVSASRLTDPEAARGMFGDYNDFWKKEN